MMPRQAPARHAAAGAPPCSVSPHFCGSNPMRPSSSPTSESTAAGSVAELASLFNDAPPPLPPKG